MQVLGHQLVSHDCSGGRWMAGGGGGEGSRLPKGGVALGKYWDSVLACESGLFRGNVGEGGMIVKGPGTL